MPRGRALTLAAVVLCIAPAVRADDPPAADPPEPPPRGGHGPGGGAPPPGRGPRARKGVGGGARAAAPAPPRRGASLHRLRPSPALDPPLLLRPHELSEAGAAAIRARPH